MKNTVKFTFYFLMLTAYCAGVRANLLPEFEPLIVNSGDLVKHDIELQREAYDGVRLEIKLISRPEGAKIVVDDQGELSLRWKTGPDLAEETELVIQARNIDTRTVIQTQTLLVRNVFIIEEEGGITLAESEPAMQAGNMANNQLSDVTELSPAVASRDVNPSVQTDDEEANLSAQSLDELPVQAAPSSIADRATPPAQPNADRNENVVAELDEELAQLSNVPATGRARTQRGALEPDRAVLDLIGASNQIVSAGRTVSMRFLASSSDGEDPVLSLDRVPSNASFERNTRGEYTLFWQTGDRDQGEHVFKVTAEHPDDESITESFYWTLVIGDPSHGRSVPSGFEQ